MIKMFVIAGLYLLDMLFTYWVAQDTAKKYPKFPIENIEVNGLVSWAWKKYGLRKGMMVGLGLTLPLLFGILIAVQVYEHLFWMTVGMYAVVFTIHFKNIEGMVSEKPSWFGELYEKAYGGRDGRD